MKEKEKKKERRWTIKTKSKEDGGLKKEKKGREFKKMLMRWIWEERENIK